MHHIIRARPPSFSSSYRVDTDREFTAKSMLTRKSLWKCSWGGPEHIHSTTQVHTNTHTLSLPYPWYSAHFERLPLDIYPLHSIAITPSLLWPCTFIKLSVCGTRGALYGCNKQQPMCFYSINQLYLGKWSKGWALIQRHPTFLFLTRTGVAVSVLAGTPPCTWNRVEQNKNNPKATGY